MRLSFYKKDFDKNNGDVAGRVLQAGRNFLRREMTELERFVLLQICDSSWKDHLLGMDHLKGAIGLRSFAEQDPKVAFKRDGSRLFEEMLGGIRQKVSEMIFKVRLAPGSSTDSVYNVTGFVHVRPPSGVISTQQPHSL